MSEVRTADVLGLQLAVVRASMPLGGAWHSREVMASAIYLVVADKMGYREAARVVSRRHGLRVSHSAVARWVGDFEQRVAAGASAIDGGVGGSGA